MFFCKKEPEVTNEKFLGKDVVVKEIIQKTNGQYGQIVETKVHRGTCIGISYSSIGITIDGIDTWFDTTGKVGGTHESMVEIVKVLA